MVHPSVQRILSYNIAQRTPEWYSYRSKRVTASEVSTVIAQGRGAETLLMKKKGPQSPGFSTEYTRIGSENEENIVEIYKQMYPEVVVHHDLSIVPHKTEGHLAASLDAVTDHGINVEIKTCFKNKLNTTIPKAYRDQVQLQMEVADLEHTHLVYQYVNMPGKPVVIHDIPRSYKWFEINAPILKKFAEALRESAFDLVLLNYQYEKRYGKSG